ncbi:MAG: SDR family oxidoreductase, partial [Hyphomonadaceae bacterium]
AGVRVNAVAPGSIISSGPKKYIGAELQPFKNLISRIPLQRRGTESETSSAIVYLLSPGAAYITGAVIRIDGGAPTARQIETLPASDKSKPYDGLHRPGELY